MCRIFREKLNKVKIKVKVSALYVSTQYCDVILVYFDFYHTFVLQNVQTQNHDYIIVKNFVHLIYIIVTKIGNLSLSIVYRVVHFY